MTNTDDRDHDVDPVLDQVRSEPNPELVHQHDDREDALDKAIESEGHPSEPEEATSATRPDEVLTA